MPSSVAPVHTPALRRDRRDRHRLSRTTAACVALGLAAAIGITVTVPSMAAHAATSPSSSEVVDAAPSQVPPDATETFEDVTAEARTALVAARSTLDAAKDVTADIAASGLDLGLPSTSVDTVELISEIEQLENLGMLPLPLLRTLVAETTEQTRIVGARVAELRERLDSALAEKAAAEAAAAEAAEAAAQAQRDAEAAAAAAAAANTVAGAQATAAHLAATNYGWGADQFSCLVSLWQKESGWNYQAYNASSGATGIPQALPGDKMASAGADWQTNATTQIVWGLEYISSVYGTPCSAWQHSQATNWY